MARVLPETRFKVLLTVRLLVNGNDIAALTVRFCKDWSADELPLKGNEPPDKLAPEFKVILERLEPST